MSVFIEDVMARGKNQKLKLLYLAKIMQEETDDLHRLTMPQLIERLDAYGIEAQRKSLYDDLDALNDFGIEILKEQVGNKMYYYAGNRDFEIAELKFLVDMVQSSKFVTEKKSKKLIEKLISLVSNHDGKLLKREVYVADRIKSMNETILYSVDSIHTAISNNQQITFHYFCWNLNGEAEVKHDGKLYQVSPWALVYDDENYYLEAYDAEEKRLKTYRVDKMQDIDVVEEKRQGSTAYKNKDKAVYSKKLFGMYDGKEEIVTLRCENHMSNVIVDRFGKKVHMRPVDDEHFEVKVEVAVSGNFLDWIIGIGGVTITGPVSVVKEMQQIKDRLIDEY